jgi:thymidylate synthase (FAD)
VLIDVLKRWVPLTHEAFLEHRFGAAQLSATALTVVRRMIAGERIDQASSGLTKREWGELTAVLGLDESGAPAK